MNLSCFDVIDNIHGHAEVAKSRIEAETIALHEEMRALNEEQRRRTRTGG